MKQASSTYSEPFPNPEQFRRELYLRTAEDNGTTKQSDGIPTGKTRHREYDMSYKDINICLYGAHHRRNQQKSYRGRISFSRNSESIPPTTRSVY